MAASTCFPGDLCSHLTAHSPRLGVLICARDVKRDANSSQPSLLLEVTREDGGEPLRFPACAGDPASGGLMRQPVASPRHLSGLVVHSETEDGNESRFTLSYQRTSDTPDPAGSPPPTCRRARHLLLHCSVSLDGPDATIRLLGTRELTSPLVPGAPQPPLVMAVHPPTQGLVCVYAGDPSGDLSGPCTQCVAISLSQIQDYPSLAPQLKTFAEMLARPITPREKQSVLGASAIATPSHRAVVSVVGDSTLVCAMVTPKIFVAISGSPMPCLLAVYTATFSGAEPSDTRVVRTYSTHENKLMTPMSTALWHFPTGTDHVFASTVYSPELGLARSVVEHVEHRPGAGVPHCRGPADTAVTPLSDFPALKTKPSVRNRTPHPMRSFCFAPQADAVEPRLWVSLNAPPDSSNPMSKHSPYSLKLYSRGSSRTISQGPRPPPPPTPPPAQPVCVALRDLAVRLMSEALGDDAVDLSSPQAQEEASRKVDLSGNAADVFAARAHMYASTVHASPDVVCYAPGPEKSEIYSLETGGYPDRIGASTCALSLIPASGERVDILMNRSDRTSALKAVREQRSRYQTLYSKISVYPTDSTAPQVLAQRYRNNFLRAVQRGQHYSDILRELRTIAAGMGRATVITKTEALTSRRHQHGWHFLPNTPPGAATDGDLESSDASVIKVNLGKSGGTSDDRLGCAVSPHELDYLVRVSSTLVTELPKFQKFIPAPPQLARRPGAVTDYSKAGVVKPVPNIYSDRITARIDNVSEATTRFIFKNMPLLRHMHVDRFSPAWGADSLDLDCPVRGHIPQPTLDVVQAGVPPPPPGSSSARYNDHLKKTSQIRNKARDLHNKFAKNSLCARTDFSGFAATEKFDGYRARWDPDAQQFRVGTTRPGGAFHPPPPRVRAIMERVGLALDGELWAGRGNFYRTRSLLASEDWEGLAFVVFDSHDASLSHCDYAERLAHIQQALRTVPTDGFVSVAPVFVVRDNNDAIDLLHHVGSYNGEGLVLKPLHNCSYLDGQWHKLKAHREASGTVVRQASAPSDVYTATFLVCADGHEDRLTRVHAPPREKLQPLDRIVFAYSGRGAQGGYLHARYERRVEATEFDPFNAVSGRCTHHFGLGTDTKPPAVKSEPL